MPSTGVLSPQVEVLLVGAYEEHYPGTFLRRRGIFYRARGTCMYRKWHLQNRRQISEVENPEQYGNGGQNNTGHARVFVTKHYYSHTKT
ncbi:hypothetical protein TcasGA2_TC008600 [Tribolium castaneum]|uniref:Uncharacterized protein n=1 Tax=Tribolium castaneum TaxID=7070 RepID=D6WTP1_TRICA|nr:hypothetical protein TcasGA2_TC008600 [Tribolium castaneum]